MRHSSLFKRLFLLFLCASASAWTLSSCKNVSGRVEGSVGNGIQDNTPDPTPAPEVDTKDWDFASSADYTFDSNYVSVSGNHAALKTVNTILNDSTSFGLGTHVGTVYSGGVLKLDASASNQALSTLWTPKMARLQAYWKMDGDWLDASGHSLTLSTSGSPTLSSTTYKVGTGSGTFGSSNSVYSTLPSSLSTYSISVWVMPTTLTDNAGVVGQRSASSPAITMAATTHYWKFGSITTSIEAIPNSWTHLVATQSGTTQTLYVNGVNSGVATATSTLTAVDIGVINGVYLTGSIDDVAVFSGALSDGDVLAIYNRQKQKFAASYDSPVFDLGNSSATWTSLTPVTSLPFDKEMTATSESSSYSGMSGSTLLNNIFGIWPFNGNLNDDSGNSHTLVVDTNATTSAAGLYSKGLTPNTGGVRNASWLNLSGTVPFTVSVWFRSSGELANTFRWLFNTRANASGSIRDDFGCLIHSDASRVHAVVCQMYLGGTFVNAGSTETAIQTGVWNHLAMTWNGSRYITYLNGSSIGTSTSTTISTNTGNVLTFGSRTPGLTGMTGLIDEAMAWSRALSATEIAQLYRRNANRLRYQVRSCAETTCACKSLPNVNSSSTDCDGDGVANSTDTSDSYMTTWIGADGTDSTYFSELQNNSAVDSSGQPTGTINGSALSLDWSGSFFTSAARPSASRYFQYRVYMESDDTHTLCSSGTATCVPEITSITVGPTGRYYGDSPSIVNNSALSFSQIYSMTRNDTSSCTTYQVSTDGGSTFKWWNAAANSGAGGWSTAGNTSSTANYLSDYTESRLQTLGSGNFKFRAFLSTNPSGGFTQPCQLSQVELLYSP